MSLDIEQDEFIKELQQCDSVIYRICMTFTDRKVESIEDLYQDIACNLWLARNKYKGECSYKTWVYHIGLNTVISQIRKRKRKPITIELTPEMEQIITEQTNNESIKRLYDLIDQLNKVEKSIILMYID